MHIFYQNVLISKVNVVSLSFQFGSKVVKDPICDKLFSPNLTYSYVLEKVKKKSLVNLFLVLFETRAYETDTSETKINIKNKK